MTGSVGPASAPLGTLKGYREGLRALTTRGRAFIAGGLTAAICGMVLGERDLVRIGALIVLLPLVTVAFFSRTGHRLTLNRTVTPNRIEVDQPASVQLELTNHGFRTGVLLLEDQVPWALGQRPRFVADPVSAQGQRQVAYPLRATLRGIYEIGPMHLRIADPFGMLALRRTFPRASTLVVVPNTEPLPPIRLRGAWTGTGDNRPRPFSIGGAADVTVRDYRLGDDLRRVHWRSTARTGELMVRREEQPWQSRCTLFVDNRTIAHRGTGPDSSLERAVTVTASIAVHLARSGFQVRLVSADGEADPQWYGDHAWHDGNVAATVGPVLERLAALPATNTPELTTSWVDDTVAAGMLIGVFGTLHQRDRALLSRLHLQGGASYAVVLDVDTWTGRGVVPDGAAVPSTSWLQQRGWKASTLTRAGSLQTAWQELGR